MESMSWDPLERLGMLRKEMDRVIDDFFRGAPFPTQDSDALEPAVDVRETPDTVVVRVVVPGMHSEHLHLTITDDTLTITGKRQAAEAHQGHSLPRRKIRPDSLQRAIPPPVRARAEDAKAHCKDGILEVRFPKSAQRKTKDIFIECSD